MKKVIMVLVGLLLVAGLAFADTVVIRDGQGRTTIQTVTGELEVTIPEAMDVTLTDTGVVVLSLPAITGAVDATLTDTGVVVLGLPAITGTVTVDTGLIEVSNFPATQAVTGDFYPLVQEVTFDTPLVVTPNMVAYAETIHNETLTDTATAYSFALPAGTIWYEIKARVSAAFRFARSEAGLENAYRTVVADEVFRVPQVELGSYSGTLWFQSDTTAGLVLEIRVGAKE